LGYSVYCDSYYQLILYMLIFYHSFLLLRLFIFCCHFRHGREVYRRMKRTSRCLRVCEHDRILVLDVYKLPDYEKIANAERSAN
jgi:hypothetical protein